MGSLIKSKFTFNHSSSQRRQALRIIVGLSIALALGVGMLLPAASRLLFGEAAAQGKNTQRISLSAMNQIEALMQEKESRTAAQKKIDSQLLYKIKGSRGELRASGIERLAVGVQEAPDGSVLLDIRSKVTPEVLAAIRQGGGVVIYAYDQFDAIRAKLPLAQLETIAGLDEVNFIRLAEEPMTNSDFRRSMGSARQLRAERAARVREQLRQALPQIAQQKKQIAIPTYDFSRRALIPTFIGSVDSEGDVAHRANQVRALNFDGTGVRIGVISDSVRFLANSQASNDLPAVVTVLAGQSGIDTINTPPNDTGEGTAMLEIVHDLAPGAQLFFATGFGGMANMATNIMNLAGNPNNCDIIVDDLTYYDEGVFQDDVIARAVNTVTSAGVLYFSSAGNSGNSNDGTSGVWEGDFVDGGTLMAVGGGRVHDFGGGVVADTINAVGGGTRPISLKWSDPLGNSNNDYDLYILNAALTTVRASSTNSQSGSQDPVERIFNNATTPVFSAGDRIVILRRTGAALRALHLNSNRGRLAISTSGQTFGHNAAGSAYTVAAVRVSTAGGGVFTGGAANPVEGFSSDGSRRIFYTPTGTEITTGNVLFGTNGGQVLQKPDIAAADCGVTSVTGFNTFCGTSAAAPHAAAIAGLLLSFNNTLTPAQVRTALTSTSLDIEAAGVDRDSGSGIVMALQAIASVSSANLAITMTDSPDPVIAGTDLAYTINVSNGGPGPAVFAKWQDSLPAGTTLQSFSPAAGWNCSTPAIGSGGAITCNRDTMAANESAGFTVVVRVAATMADGATISNTATVSSTVGDPNNGNNSATSTTSVIRRADLEILSKIDTPDPVVTNTPLTYTITLRNNGPSVATSISLNDALPSGVTFTGCSSTGGGVCGGAGQNRVVTFASLNAGAGAIVTLVTRANCGLADGAVIQNSATITAATIDPTPANNSAMASTVAKDPPPVILCPSSLDVIVSIPGNRAAIATFANPVVTDNCPGVTFVCSATSGASFPLGTTTVTCVATDSNLSTSSCSFGITVWDASVQDEFTKDAVMFNTFTGDYKFFHCGSDAFSLVGRGVVRRASCTTELRGFAPTLSASFERCPVGPKNTGQASISLPSGARYTVGDSNILNNSPSCPIAPQSLTGRQPRSIGVTTGAQSLRVASKKRRR